MNVIAKLLVKWCEKRDRKYIITGGPQETTPYLVRYIVFKSNFFCIYIHRFMRSDSDTPHDHPWNFFTYILDGSYREHYYDTDLPQKLKTKYKKFWTEKVNIRKPGSLAYRKATDIHYVEVDKKRDLDEIEDAPFTMCFMFRRQRHWGFWSEDGSTFTDWRRYLNINPNDPRIEGSE